MLIIHDIYTKKKTNNRKQITDREKEENYVPIPCSILPLYLPLDLT